MSKVAKPVPKKMTVPDALINLATRLKHVEGLTTVQLKALELKIGEHENKFIENSPDMDQLAEMFKMQNAKIEELNNRIIELEKKNDIKPPKKKGGTVKLNDLETEPGISFSSTT
jgi:hypothetical protein